MVKYAAATLFFWLTTVSEVLAFSSPGGGGRGFGDGGGHGGPTTSAPEIDSAAGVAAIALLVSAGFIAYNRYKKKK
jgi:hypothetical protein